MNEEFLKKIDLFGTLRKKLFNCQQHYGIQAVKPCTVTSECFTLFLNSTLKNITKNIPNNGKP